MLETHRRRSGVFIVYLEYISHCFLVFLFLTLKRQNFTWEIIQNWEDL